MMPRINRKKGIKEVVDKVSFKHLGYSFSQLNRTTIILIILVLLFLGFFIFALPALSNWLPNPIETQSFELEKNKETRSIQESCNFKYSIQPIITGLFIHNDSSSSTEFVFESGTVTNKGVSCFLELRLNNSMEFMLSAVYPITSRISIGTTGFIYFDDLYSGVSLRPLYPQTLSANLVCEKNRQPCISISDGLQLYEFPQQTLSGKVLLIDASDNSSEYFVSLSGDTMKTKKMVVELRQLYSGTLSIEMKVMGAGGLGNEYNIVFFNTEKYYGDDSVSNDFLALTQHIVENYNDIPFKLIPMTKQDYRQNIEYWETGTCNPKNKCTATQYVHMKEKTNPYDIRFLDKNENYELDFWVFLANEKR